jgi:hypothetical protein
VNGQRVAFSFTRFQVSFWSWWFESTHSDHFQHLWPRRFTRPARSACKQSITRICFAFVRRSVGSARSSSAHDSRYRYYRLAPPENTPLNHLARNPKVLFKHRLGHCTNIRCWCYIAAVIEPMYGQTWPTPNDSASCDPTSQQKGYTGRTMVTALHRIHSNRTPELRHNKNNSFVPNVCARASQLCQTICQSG